MSPLAQTILPKDKRLIITTRLLNPPRELVTLCEFIVEGPRQARLKVGWVYSGVDDVEASTFHVRT